MGNSTRYEGGGAYSSALNNCTLTANSASEHGGGAYYGTLNNCTLTGNSARDSGGGAYYATLNNCLVYYNSAPTEANYSQGTLNYCCTTPLPGSGAGNFATEPQLASLSHLSASSPCRGAGSAAYTTGVDIDGEAWANPPSSGCDEYRLGAVTGPLSVAIQATYTNVATEFEVQFTAQIGGRVSASRWDYGDGTIASNRPYASHAWATVGDYQVVLRAYNESYPDGVSATVTVHVMAGPIHVALQSTNPLAPYASWDTAATNIQDAVDAAYAGGTVLVSNGVYAAGGRAVYGAMTNRVAVDKPVTVQSVNGPAVTVIQGYPIIGDSAVRCVYLANGATLIGFTLTNGATGIWDDSLGRSGGGVWCESATAVVSNCVLTGNSASSGGGGTYSGTLNNCTLTGNSASYGGGAYESTLNNCVLERNSADSGGGANGSTLNNCIVYYNTANSGSNYNSGYGSGTINYCCTTPQPNNGVGNITNEPGFFDYAHSNLRLQSNSPCINAGNNAYAPVGPDLDGSPRIVGGTVDIGAYECQSPALLAYYTWLQSYGLPTHSSDLYADSDGDLMNNWQEWRCGTDPTNALSILRLLTPAVSGSGVVVRWESVAGRTYFLERSTDLGAQPQFQILASHIAGQPGTTSYTDTNAVGRGPFFYRVGVEDFSTPSSVIPLAWLQQYGLPTDGSADYTDPDGDRRNNWQEWRCGTNPTNVLSVLRLLTPVVSGSGLVVRWESVSGRAYFLERSSDLGAQPAFLRLAGQIAGQPGTTSYTDTNAVGFGPFFYRVGVEEFPTVFSAISFAWLQRYGLPTDGSADFQDADADGLNNWQEWRADTDPTNAESVLRMLSSTRSVSSIVVSWQSVPTRKYLVQRGSDLAGIPHFLTLATNLAGQTGATTFTDTNTASAGPFFYRVGVQE
jgi:hypothetical protein